MSTHRMLVPDGAALVPRASIAPADQHANGNDPFLAALLEMPTTNARDARKPLKMAASMLIHTAAIALMIIVPVYFASTSLTLQKYEPTYVFTAPTLAPPPPAGASLAAQSTVQTPQIVQRTFVAPRSIPKALAQTASNNTNVSAPDLDAGVVGGVPGGVPGGILGGVLGGNGAMAALPPPTNAHGLVRVGGNVKAPQLLQRIQPDYPAVARAAHVEGTVVIDAVIDATGKVVSEHAVSGPGLLIPAALSAVEQWQYQPTYLNGEPVELSMEVTVSFNLG